MKKIKVKTGWERMAEKYQPVKKTLRFAYWIDANPFGQPEWYALYFIQCGDGVTQIDACAALARGFLLDPETPTLKQWQSQNKSEGLK